MFYNIEIYTKKDCPYCTRAKLFLRNKSLKFKEIFVDDDKLKEVYLKEMRHRSKGCCTVPQVFINGYHIGGSDDLLKLGNDLEKLNYFLNNKDIPENSNRIS